MNWQSAFQTHTTNIAFNLTLSRRMVDALIVAKLYHDGWNSWQMPVTGSHFVTSMKCLKNRGLVEHHNYEGMAPRNHKWWTLTPAGLAVYSLCQYAGLIPQEQTASNEASQ